jgi:hypothetical protein
MPYNGDKVTLSDSYIDEVKIIAENTTSTDYVYNDQLIIDTEIQDPNSSYNPATSTYTSEYALNVPNSIQFKFTVDYEILLDNTYGSPITCVNEGVYIPSIRVDSNLSFYNNKNLFNGNVLISSEGKIILEKSDMNAITDI